jgi:hypothetical protein
VYETFTDVVGPDLELRALAPRTIRARPMSAIEKRFAARDRPPEKTLPLHLVRALVVGTRFPADVERLERALAALTEKGLYTNYQGYDVIALERTFDPSR